MKGMVRNDRVVWATSMVACGDADGAVTGNTRRFGASLEKIKQVNEEETKKDEKIKEIQVKSSF